MIRRGGALTLALVLLLVGCRAEPQTPAATQPAMALSPAGLEVIPLEIRSGGRVHRFNVEVAQSADEQARGLMFRQSLEPDSGMLFPMVPPRPAGFWMKNTLIPLDMLFIRPDGSIARIAVNTTPHSLESIRVSEPVAAVLELAGGRTLQLGIDSSARVTWASSTVP